MSKKYSDDNNIEIILGENSINIIGNAFEYWCNNCGQLRLCFDKKRITCGNCGEKLEAKYIDGPGKLDVNKLREEFKTKKDKQHEM